MAQRKDKERYGRSFAPDCEFKVYELNDNMGWCASVAIGDCYYETDPYANKQDAIDEQRGCLLAIKEQIEKYLEKEQVAPVLWNNASEDLEQAIDTYLATYFGGEKEQQEWPYLKKMAIHFAEWQKQQLMAKAVDVTITIPYQNGYGGYTQLVDSKEGLPFGENLKVLVIEKEIEL